MNPIQPGQSVSARLPGLPSRPDVPFVALGAGGADGALGQPELQVIGADDRIAPVRPLGPHGARSTGKAGPA